MLKTFFSFVGGKSVNLPIRKFEVWVKREERGVFITMERTFVIDTVEATTVEEATSTARSIYGQSAYAVPMLK